MALLTQTVSKATAAVTAATAKTVSGSGIQAWIGYHVAIVSGTGAGQVRFAASSPGTNQLNISPDWDVIPDTSSVIHQAKNAADYNVEYGNNWKLVSKATAEWDAGNADGFQIGNGTDPALFGIFGQAISLDNVIIVANNGYFSIGGLFGSVSLGGWYFNSNNANSALGHIFLQVLSGGVVLIHNVTSGTVFAHKFDFQVGSIAYIYDYSLTNLAYGGSNLLGTIYGHNLKLQGVGSVNDFLNINTGINTFDGPVICSNSYGLKPVGSSQTIIVNKFISANVPLRDVEALGANIVIFRDGTFGGATGQPITLWTDNTGASGWDREVSLNVAVKAGATLIENARFVIVEGTTVKTLVNRGDSDASGLFSDYILKYRARTSAGITTYLPNLATCYKYGYQPFSAAIDPTVAVTLPIPLNVDSTTAVDESTALAYSGITFNKFTANKHTGLAFDAYTGTIVVDDVLTQTPSGASGIVKDIIDNGDGSGTVFLINRNAVAFVDNQALQVSAVTQAVADTPTFNRDFTWGIDANSLSTQNVNDYHLAKLAMASPVDSWVAELQERFGRVIDKSGAEFFTNNTSNEGAWIYNRGAGAIKEFTSDDGGLYIPPSTNTFTVTGLISGLSEVRVRDGSVTLPGGNVNPVVGTTFAMPFSAYASANKVTLSVVTPGYDYVTKEIILFNVDVTENLTLEPDPSWVP